MNDRAWAEGMAELQKSGMPGWPTDPKESLIRSGLYRRHLDDLGEEAWFFAVAEAVRLDRWFPTVAALRDYAAGWTPLVKRLPAPTPEERERALATRRENAARAAAVLREGLATRGLLPVGEPVRSFPGTEAKEPTFVRSTDARRAELERQRKEIGD